VRDAISFGSASIEIQLARQFDPKTASERPTVVVMDDELRRWLGAAGARQLAESGAALVAIGAAGETDVPADLPGADVISAFIPAGAGTRQLLVALRAAYREAAARIESARARSEVAQRSREITELTRIGMALSTERNYDVLLEMILTQARQVTQSDGGSLYLVERQDGSPPRLRFKLAQSDTLTNKGFVEFTMPLDHASLAGYVCSTGEPLVIDDVYFLPPDVEYSFNRSFDERVGYRSKSMLTVPMLNHHDEVIGAVQLINRKRDPAVKLTGADIVERQVIPYSRRIIDVVSALAGQAAVSIENSLLYQNIEQLFEGFVKASVTAIEQRDPTTSGHSERVATMTVGLAEVVDRAGAGPYSSINFSRDQLLEAAFRQQRGLVGAQHGAQELVQPFQLAAVPGVQALHEGVVAVLALVGQIVGALQVILGLRGPADERITAADQ